MLKHLNNSRDHSTVTVLCADHNGEVPDHKQTMSLLYQTAAVLLRGFRFDADSFVKFSNCCCAGFSKYRGGAFRFRSLDRVSLGAEGTLLSTTGGKQGFPIPLHGEMYYQQERPDTLWLFCRRAPKACGETTVADGQKLFERLPLRSKELLRCKKLCYVRDLSADDWPTTFQTHDLEEVREICRRGNSSLSVRLDNSIEIRFTCSALLSGNNGREIFINNLVSVWKCEREIRAGNTNRILGTDVCKRPPLSIRLDDSTEPPEWLIADIEAASEVVTTAITWQCGDVLVLDNRRMLHGRRQAVGDDREILVRLGHLPVHSDPS
jgi:alpha-ketoglutarate-dependent taurine dioxygenase